MARDQPSTKRRFGTVWDEDEFDAAVAWKGMHAVFKAAVAARPADLCEASFRFAGRPVHFRVAGPELFAHIIKPFAHLRTDETSVPELTVELWDDRFAGALPEPEQADGHTLWREKTLLSADDRFIAQQLPHTSTCLDRHARHLVGGIAWHDAIFIYERSKPFARAFLTWYNDRQVQVIHTGLVARAGTGVLLAGKSGSGKSTSTLVSVMAGLQYLSEDYVGLEAFADGTFVGHSVYGSVFLYSDHLRYFTGLARHAIHGRPPQEEKSVVLLAQIFPERLARSAHIRAVVFPRVAEQAEARLEPMSKGAALLALAPSSLLQIPNRQLGAAGFDRLAQVVERLPCFQMSVGRDFASIPRRLDELIATVSPQ